MPFELTTVADDAATFHEDRRVDHLDGLAPDTDYEHRGVAFRTLVRPSGVLRCRFATVNDVHFGEEEAGRIDDRPDGPIKRVPAGAPPFPETMNRAAAAELAAVDLAAVVVKGDLTSDGTPEEFAAFEPC